MSVAWESIRFEMPWVLLGLLAVLALGVILLRQQRQYWHDAFAYSRLAALAQLKQHPNLVWKQRIGPLCLLLALSTGVIGLANPTHLQPVTSEKSALVLIMDISNSMLARDIRPNRLTAAKQSAIQFIEALPETVDTGLILFAGNTVVISPLTTNHVTLTHAIKELTPDSLRPGTAIGDALVTGVEVLSQQMPAPGQKSLTPQGSLVLMTDGESNIGLSPVLALEQVKKHGYRIFSVGVGAEQGAFLDNGTYTQLDEPTLRWLATETDGHYYRVKAFQEFKPIYQDIQQRVMVTETRRVPLMPWCLGATCLGILAGLTYSLWQRRFTLT